VFIGGEEGVCVKECVGSAKRLGVCRLAFGDYLDYGYVR
jgi:hypothetical protein